MNTRGTAQWYISGPHSSDYFLLLDEQSEHIFAMRLAAHIRDARGSCDPHVDLVTASLPEIWIDDMNKRLWYVFENSCSNDATDAD